MKSKTSFRLGLIPIALASSLLSTTSIVSAEENEASDERVVVTGSRIRQSQAAGNAPVTTLTRADLDKTGLTSVADILQKMSTSGAALNTRFNSSGNFGMPPDGGGVGAGGAEVDLRHLGSDRVLVLVDGRRWVNASSASGVSGSVDLNTIPLSVVERIEVLEDGASSIYGSDAIGGVVNIITRKDFSGWQFTTSYGGFGDSPLSIDDGETGSFEITFGAQGDRHNIVTSISHVDSNVVFSKDRSLAGEPIAGTGTTRGSSATPYGRFLFVDGNGDVVNTTPNGDAGNLVFPNDFHDFTNNDRFNYSQYNLYVTPSSRTNFFTRAEYDLTNDVTFFTQAMFNRRSSKNQAAPEPIFIGPEAGAGPIANSVSIDITNPYNPFGLTLDDSNFIFAGRRPIEAGPREYYQHVNTHYISTGFEGSFDAGNNAMYWDVTMSWGKNDATQIKTGALNAARIKRALGPVADCNSDPSCVPLNIFGAGAITPEMLDYISFTQKDASQNSVQLFSANLSGDLFEMPGGYAGFATGYEHRSQDGFFSPDAIAQSGETMGIPASPTAGGFDADEYFFEGKFPFADGLAYADYLEMSVALRRSEYTTSANSSFDATTHKVGLLWRPMPELTIRATQSEGFRAPSIGEMFNTGARSDSNLTDPCDTTDAAARSRCDQVWGAIDYNALDLLGQTQIGVQTKGNPLLKPEESESLTYGFVYSPDWFDNSKMFSNISFEMTFYDHEIDNAIQAIDAQTQLDECVGNSNDVFCGGIERANNVGITTFDNGLQNIGRVMTSGMDFKLKLYSQELDWGRLAVTWNNSFVSEYKTEVFGETSQDLDGIEFGSNPDRAIPEWKYDLNLNWRKDDLAATLTMRYISKIWEGCYDGFDGADSLAELGLCSNPDLADNSNSYNILDETYYFDLQVEYSTKIGGYNTDFAIGARNLFDQDPPQCTQCDLNGYLPGVYDPQGRYWYARFTIRP